MNSGEVCIFSDIVKWGVCSVACTYNFQIKHKAVIHSFNVCIYVYDLLEWQHICNSAIYVMFEGC